jgi:hypothetical protein
MKKSDLMLYRLLGKNTVILWMGLFSVCFSMEEPESPFCAKAQEFFQLSSECDPETEQAEKQEFARWALKELENGVEKKEINSIYWMMEFCKDGLGNLIPRNMQRYEDLNEELRSATIALKQKTEKTELLIESIQKPTFGQPSADKKIHYSSSFEEEKPKTPPEKKEINTDKKSQCSTADKDDAFIKEIGATNPQAKKLLYKEAERIREEAKIEIANNMLNEILETNGHINEEDIINVSKTTKLTKEEVKKLATLRQAF